MPLVQDGSRGADIHRDAQSQIFRLHLQRTKSGGFFRKAYSGDHSRRTAGALLIHLPMPRAQLLLKILLV